MNLASVLLDDPELARELDLARAETATRQALARVALLPKGMFCPYETLPAKPGTLGMLVLEGLLLRAVQVERRPSVEVFGPGDVLRPFQPGPDPFAVADGGHLVGAEAGQARRARRSLHPQDV